MVEELLQRLKQACQPGPYDYRYCHHQFGESSQGAVTLCVLTHGNEVGALPAALQLIEQLKSGQIESRLPVTLVVGNPEAARADQRYLQEDLNRVFTFDRPAESHERKRAEQLRPILDDAFALLDLHQTQAPTSSPFFTFPWTRRLGAWARALGHAPVGLTRRPDAQFSPGNLCLDEYVRESGQVGLTLELGTRGLDDEQARQALSAMKRFIDICNAAAAGDDIETWSDGGAPIAFHQTTFIERRHDQSTVLRPGLGSWTWVEAGEAMTTDPNRPLQAPASGYVLFPKYPVAGKELPPELYRLAEPIVDLSVLES